MSTDRLPREPSIELIAPNAGAFEGLGGPDLVDTGDEAAQDEPHDARPHSKWAVVTATAIVLGFLAGGVIAAEPWNAGDSATPTTTSPDDTIAQDVDLGPDDLAAAGSPSLVVDRPGSFELASAWAIDPRADPKPAPDREWFGLWATPGATRTSGRWLAITTLRARAAYYETRPGGSRIEVGRDYGVLTTGNDGVTTLIFTAHDDTPIEIGGFGVTLDEMRSIADELESAQHTLYLLRGPATSAVIRDMDSLVQMAVPVGGLDLFDQLSQPISGADYVGPTTAERFDIQLGTPVAVDGILFDFLVKPLDLMLMSDAAQLDALARAGTRIRVGTDPYDPTTLILTWPTDRGTVTVSSSGVPLSTLLAVLRSARVPGQSEWAEMVRHTSPGQMQLAPGVGADATRTLIGVRPLDSPDAYWQIEMATHPAAVFLSAGASGWSGPIGQITGTPTTRQFASKTMTFLVGAVLPTSPARTMRVTVEGRTPVDVPMVDVGDAAARAAGFAFPEIAATTVEFLDDAGHVIG